MEFNELKFDIEAMAETHPGINADPRIFLEAMCHHNPHLSREICALFSARLLAQCGVPNGPENNQSLMAAIKWLQSQAGDLQMHDPNEVMTKGLGGDTQ